MSMKGFTRTHNMPLRGARRIPTACCVCGFTLIETMVAVTILTLAISGAFLTANSAIVAAGIARDQLTASYLAQEGIEYARLIRDDDYLAAYHMGGANVSTAAWASFLSSLGTGTIVYPAPNLGTPTSFTRTLQATSVTASEEKIVSKVSWSFHGVPYSVTIIDHLTPWQ